MDSGPTHDYASMYSDVYVLPESDEGGIYLLEEGVPASEPDYPGRAIRRRDLSSVRMRKGGRRERFSGSAGRDDDTGLQTFAEYQASIPGQQGLKSSRRGRRSLDDSVWDERPRGFNPNDGPRASAFYPPPQVRPPQGGIITPWQLSYAPSQSEAMMRQGDSAMVGLAPCGALPTPAHLGGREKFSDPSCGDPHTVSAKNLELGLQMVKVVLFFVIVVLLAIYMVTSAVQKNIMKTIKLTVQDAMRTLKSPEAMLGSSSSS